MAKRTISSDYLDLADAISRGDVYVDDCRLSKECKAQIVKALRAVKPKEKA